MIVPCPLCRFGNFYSKARIKLRCASSLDFCTSWKRSLVEGGFYLQAPFGQPPLTMVLPSCRPMLAPWPFFRQSTRLTYHRTASNYHQPPDNRLSHFRDAAQPLLSAGRVLAQCQAEPAAKSRLLRSVSIGGASVWIALAAVGGVCGRRTRKR